MKTLVIPSVREHCLFDFLKSWHTCGDWDNIIVIEDNPERTFNINPGPAGNNCVRPWNLEHYSWKEIENRLGENSWIISRRDSAIRCFGFLMAYESGADYIFTLDDDCWPGEERFCEGHIKNLKNTPQWTESIPETRTRGLPYQHTGNMKNVAASMGLWTGNPDFDAIQEFGQLPEVKIPNQNRIVPFGQYFPFCGMNFCIIKEMAVASYFPIMGQHSPYGRFDDIWFGIIFKKVADHLGYSVSVGKPTIHHTKASNRYKNLIKEAPGISANEYFWRIIDGIPLTGKNPKDCMLEIGTYLQKDDVPYKDEFENDYLNNLGKAIVIWVGLF